MRFGYPGNTIGSKVRPDCLKITRIVQHCEWGSSAKLAQNVVADGDKGACNSSYVYGKNGDFETKADEKAPTVINRMGIFTKGYLGKLQRNL